MQRVARIPKNRKQLPRRKAIHVSDLAKQLAEIRALRDLVRRTERQPGKVGGL